MKCGRVKLDGLLIYMEICCRCAGNTKASIYDSDLRSGLQLYSQSSPRDLAVVEGQRKG